MKARVHYKFSEKQRDIIRAEVNKEVLNLWDTVGDNFDAMILYSLHKKYNFGPEQLREFWEATREETKKLKQYYEMPNDGPYLAKQMLLRIGVDITAWNCE